MRIVVEIADADLKAMGSIMGGSWGSKRRRPEKLGPPKGYLYY